MSMANRERREILCKKENTTIMLTNTEP